MKTIFKAICILAAYYFIFQLGRWYGQVESLPQRTIPNIFDNRVETYNEIMLKNCLQNKNDSIR